MTCALFSCEDQGCIGADDLGGIYFVVQSNPDAVYGEYPNQSTEWLDTGLRASGGGFTIAISGGFSPWSLNSPSPETLNNLPSCIHRTAADLDPVNTGHNNFGLCSKLSPIDNSSSPPALLAGQARVTALNQQNCICYKGERPVPMPNAARDGVTACTDPTNPEDCSCDNSGGDRAAEGDCIYTYDLITHEKNFDANTGDPIRKNTDLQGTTCRYEKGLGLYMGLFGSSGNVQPLRLYHLFSQEERCPITRDAQGRCVQETDIIDENGDPKLIDRTRYIYTSPGGRIPIYDDRSGNNCTDNNPNDDQYHRMREVIKLKISDSYYRDNYGDYTVEFLSGVYSDSEVLIMEYVVSVLEEVLLGKVNMETGVKEGGILEFIYNSIIGDSRFILAVQLMLVLYITFFGVSVLMGLTEISRKEIFTRIFQIAIVLTFTTANGWQFYNDYVVAFFKDGMDEVTGRIMSFSDVYMEEYGGDAVSSINNSRLIAANPDSMGAKFAYVDSIIRMMFSEVVTKKIWSLFFYQWLGFLYVLIIYGLIFFFLWTMSIVVFVYCVTLTKMVLALALGPIFISFILFKQTNEYFKKWIGFLAARALEVVILFLIVFAFVSLIDRKFNELLYFQSCIVEWDLWLFKLKFLVAQDAYEISNSGSVTQNSRTLVSWMEMFLKMALLMYMTKEVIGQVPALAGKLISVGGAANQTGLGTSFAKSGFDMARGAVGEVFGGAASQGASAASNVGGKVARGIRKALTGTILGRAVGKASSYSPIKPRSHMRNKVIDADIKKAAQLADSQGKTGADKDRFIRSHLLDGKYTKNEGGGLRGWANENKNSAAALNINTETISKRLDQKLFEQPLKEAMKSMAKELKGSGPGQIMLGKELKERLEVEARKWAEKNSSLGEGQIDKLIDKISNKKSYTKDGGFLDHISDLDYNKASKDKRFGSEDHQEDYLKYLKSKKFDKTIEKSEVREFEKESWKKGSYYAAAKSKLGRFKSNVKGIGGIFSNESKAFVRRANDRDKFIKGRYKFSRDERDKKLEDLEFRAVRSYLMDGDLSKDIAKIKDRYGEDSVARKRAKRSGASAESMLDKKRDKEIENSFRKQKLYAKSLKEQYNERIGKLSPREKEQLRKDLKENEGYITTKHRESLLNNQDIRSRESRFGLESFELESGKSIKIGDKEYSELSVAEMKMIRDALGVDPLRSARVGAGEGVGGAGAGSGSGGGTDRDRSGSGEAGGTREGDSGSARGSTDRSGSGEAGGRVVGGAGSGSGEAGGAGSESTPADPAPAPEETPAPAPEETPAPDPAPAVPPAPETPAPATETRAPEETPATETPAPDEEAVASVGEDLTALGQDQLAQITNLQEMEAVEELKRVIQEMERKLEEERLDKERLEAAIENESKAKEALRELFTDSDKDKVDKIILSINNQDLNIPVIEEPLLPEITEAIDKYKEAVTEYNQIKEEIESRDQKDDEGNVIVRDLEIKFGASITDALCAGSGSALLEGGDASIGGAYDSKKGSYDHAMLAIMNGEVVEYSRKLQSGKNKVRYLEYDLGNLEKEHGKDGIDHSQKINQIKSEIASIESDNIMNQSRMESAKSQADSLTNDRMV